MLGISLSPGYIYTSRSGAGSVTSGVETATASGGNSPYTYAWTYVSGDLYTITASSSAATAFSTSLRAYQFKSGVYNCTVTDSFGASAYANATIEFEATGA
jgi:hypothetical protein